MKKDKSTKSLKDTSLNKLVPEKDPKLFTIKHFIFILAVVVVVNLFFYPAKDFKISHQVAIDTTFNLSPQFMKRLINNYKGNFLLIGNSTLGFGVHQGYFQRLTQVPTVVVAPGASESAWWYLAFKNVVCTIKNKPKAVGFVFRDHYLTEPTYRATAENKERIDMLCNAEEPVLDKLAYYDGLSNLEINLNTYWPLYQKRPEILKSFNTSVKNKITNIFTRLPENSADSILQKVFAKENLDLKSYGAYQNKMESTTELSVYDFKNKIGKSFVPEIIRLAKENNIKLIFIRYKRRRDVIPNSESKELKQYMADMKNYLQKNKVDFYDFTQDKRITEAFYADGDHFNQEPGMKTFTEILAATLKPSLKGLEVDTIKKMLPQ